METTVDILGLVVKFDTLLIDGILTRILEESKIDEFKIVESKIDVDKIGEPIMDVLKTEEVKIRGVKIEELNLVDEEGVCSLVHEVEVTFFHDMLS